MVTIHTSKEVSRRLAALEAAWTGLGKPGVLAAYNRLFDAVEKVIGRVPDDERVAATLALAASRGVPAPEVALPAAAAAQRALAKIKRGELPGVSYGR